MLRRTKRNLDISNGYPPSFYRPGEALQGRAGGRRRVQGVSAQDGDHAAPAFPQMHSQGRVALPGQTLTHSELYSRGERGDRRADGRVLDLRHGLALRLLQLVRTTQGLGRHQCAAGLLHRRHDAHKLALNCQRLLLHASILP